MFGAMRVPEVAWVNSVMMGAEALLKSGIVRVPWAEWPNSTRVTSDVAMIAGVPDRPVNAWVNFGITADPRSAVGRSVQVAFPTACRRTSAKYAAATASTSSADQHK
jgi:hypothetical protein